MAAVVSDSDGAWKGRGKQVYRDIKGWKNLKINNLKLKPKGLQWTRKTCRNFSNRDHLGPQPFLPRGEDVCQQCT